MKYHGTLFNNKDFDIEKLKIYGFKKQGEKYIYRENFMNNTFNAIISITDNQNIDIQVKEISTNSDYDAIFIKHTEGKFIGEAKQQLEQILENIAQNCTNVRVFKTQNAHQIIEHIKTKYQDFPEYLWEKFPNNAIFRDKINQKWYAAILTTKKSSIGLTGDEEIEVINLKAKPHKILELTDHKNYFPAYHMNKKHWYSIYLNGSLNINEIYSRIDESYQSVISKK